MADEVRTVCFDADLSVEAYRFEGVMLRFPNHFHDYYVIGFIEKGQRYLQCNHRAHVINAGDVLIFNPLDTHTCEQIDAGRLDYRCINIKSEILQKAVGEITGEEQLPRFTQNVICHSELASCLRELHQMILDKENDFKKKELFFLLIEQLLREYSNAARTPAIEQPAQEIQTVCDYLEQHYADSITLDRLSALAGLSKYHLIRSFTRQKGISPYCYLEAIRIGKAKGLLETGALPVEVAFQTGFSDQSHFSNLFKRLIGLTPRQYRKIFTEEISLTAEDAKC